MHISPKSEPDDGALDVLVMAGPKAEAFTALPKVYRGTHLPHRNIVELRASRVRVEADPPFPIEADGEHLGTTPATFEIVALPIQVKL
jgi:diacylglycerol kinase (ATP)